MSIIHQFDAIALIFVAFNLLRLASYIPQILAVARDRNRAGAISISCLEEMPSTRQKVSPFGKRGVDTETPT